MAEERNDFELMRAIAAGDDDAFRVLVEKYQREVYGTIVKMLGDAVEAEDLAQRVFLRVHQAAPRYQPTAQFKTWLFTILRNLVFNECQRRSRSRLTSMVVENSDGETVEREWRDETQLNPADQALTRERWQKINSAIQTLPEPQRMAVLLKSHQGMSYEEIAAVLKTSVSATKSLLFRARETLREKLADYLQEN